VAKDLKFYVFDVTWLVILHEELLVFVFKVHVTTSQDEQVDVRQNIEADFVRLSGFRARHQRNQRRLKSL
jgi:hypothetical protein